MAHKLIESILARYNELEPEGGSKFTPRVGFYLIQEVFEDSKHVAFYKAKALWKERQEDQFIEGALVEVQLMSFIETAPNPGSFDVNELTLKTVQVHDCFWSKTEYKSKSYPLLVCKWTTVPTPTVGYSAAKYTTIPLDTTPLIPLQSTPVIEGC